MQEDSKKQGEINFFEMLGIPKEELHEYSVRLSKRLEGYDVIQMYYENREELLQHAHGVKWSDQKNQNHIHTKYVLQFLELEDKRHWVFIGCSKILPGFNENLAGLREKSAKYEMVKRYEPYAARLVVEYKRRQGPTAITINLNNLTDREHLLSHMKVHRIAPSPISAVPFPGFDKVCLTHRQLVAALENEDWHAALNSVSAVYLQTDMSNGWHYVGSAYSQKGSDTGLLSRWKEYAENYNGGNAQLKKLSPEHIEKNFQYSILEIFDRRAKAKDIIRREHWWMDALGSVYTDDHPFGYNSSGEREREPDEK